MRGRGGVRWVTSLGMRKLKALNCRSDPFHVNTPFLLCNACTRLPPCLLVSLVLLYRPLVVAPPWRPTRLADVEWPLASTAPSLIRPGS